jgi:uncharacterized membrane protein
VGLATVVVAMVVVVVVVLVVVVVVVVLLMLMLLKLSKILVGDVAVEDGVVVVMEVVVVVLLVLLTVLAKDSEASSSRSTIKIGTRHSAMSVMWLRFISLSICSTSSKSRCVARTASTSAISAGVGKYPISMA